MFKLENRDALIDLGGEVWKIGTIEGEDMFGRHLLTPTQNFWHFWKNRKGMLKSEGFMVDKDDGRYRVTLRRDDIDFREEFLEVHPDRLLKEAETFLGNGYDIKNEMGLAEDGWDIDSIRSAVFCSLNATAKRWEYIGGVPLATILRRNSSTFEEVANEHFRLAHLNNRSGEQAVV